MVAPFGSLNIDSKIKTWIEGVPVEASALEQLRNVASLDFVTPYIAVMPDVHFGIGATVGSVIPTVNAIIPAAVGVDIGCGMSAVRLSLTSEELPNNLKQLRFALEEKIPVGFTDYGENIPEESKQCWHQNFQNDYEKLAKKYSAIVPKREPIQQLGTLGGGNHFIELCLDETNHLWLMLHTGSRGIGNRIGTHFISLAKEEIIKKGISIPDKNLAWLNEGSELFNDYICAVHWAQMYAAYNRKIIRDRVLSVLEKFLPKFSYNKTIIDCHHNYVERCSHYYLTRKGAVAAYKNTMGIIPGSMGAKSFIVRGLGNEESFCSCSHGAGRIMSRGEAKRSISLEEHIIATSGVECRKDKDVIDESPAAYKNIKDVMNAQRDLVEIVHTLKQILCVKG